MLDLSITTERLVLRPFRLNDAPRMQELIGVWEIASMLVRVPHPYPEGAAESWIASHDALRADSKEYPFAATLDGAVIGCFSVDDRKDDTLALGYWLAIPYWGCGYATEAAAAVVAFAFDWRAAGGLRSNHFIENAASGRVLAKLGFTVTGRNQLHSQARGGLVDCINLELTRDAYMARAERTLKTGTKPV